MSIRQRWQQVVYRCFMWDGSSFPAWFRQTNRLLLHEVGSTIPRAQAILIINTMPLEHLHLQFSSGASVMWLAACNRSNNDDTGVFVEVEKFFYSKRSERPQKKKGSGLWKMRCVFFFFFLSPGGPVRPLVIGNHWKKIHVLKKKSPAMRTQVLRCTITSSAVLKIQTLGRTDLPENCFFWRIKWIMKLQKNNLAWRIQLPF